MLYFITGKPGNGKTLYVIWLIRELAKRTGRPIYYDGIPLTDEGVKTLGWTPLDKVDCAEKLPDGRVRCWPQLPEGAIVLVDEVQRYWRARPQGSKVPLFVQGLEQHRHFGFDIYFLTQAPTKVDVDVRNLVWEHTHIKRTYALEKATLYKFKQRVASVDSKSDYHDALSEMWFYPKDVYGLYKSSELHTAKGQLPWKKIAQIAAVVLFFVGAAVWVLRPGSWVGGEESEKVSPAVGPSTKVGLAKGPSNGWSAEMRSARVKGLDESAPLYDGLNRAVSKPSVAGCMQMVYSDGEVECACYSAQNSRLSVTNAQCLELMRNGWFDPSKAARDQKRENIAMLNARDHMLSSQPTPVEQPAKTTIF